MAKDPAMLWYWSDWNSGTALLTRFLKGCYMDLLHAQFNNGRMSIDEIKMCLGTDFDSSWPILQKKFKKDQNGMFYNERLESEKTKRKQFTESRRSNLSKKKKDDENPHMESHMKPHMDNHMDAHMENRNRNVNNNDLGKGGMGEKPELTEPQLVELLKTDEAWQMQMMAHFKVDKATLMHLLKDFVSHRTTRKQTFNGRMDYLSHFTNWIRKKNLSEYRAAIFKKSTVEIKP
jgi:hypothetical protein